MSKGVRGQLARPRLVQEHATTASLIDGPFSPSLKDFRSPPPSEAVCSTVEQFLPLGNFSYYLAGIDFLTISLY